MTGFSSPIPPSPNLSRLDRILQLVTQHDANYRSQDLKVSKLEERLTHIETRAKPEVLQVEEELNAARIALENLHNQVATLNHEQEGIRAQHEVLLKELQMHQQNTDAKLERLFMTVENFQHAHAVDQHIDLQLSAHSTALQQSAGDLKSCKAGLAQLQTDMVTMQDVDKLQQWVRAGVIKLAKKVSKQAHSLTACEQRLMAQQSALKQQVEGSLAAERAQVDAALDSRVAESCADLERKLDLLRTPLNEVAAAQAAVKEQLQTVVGDVAALQGQQQKVHAKLRQKERKENADPQENNHAGEHKQAVQELGKAVEELRTRLSSVEATCSSTSGEVLDLSGSVEAVQDAVLQRTKEIYAVAEKVGALLRDGPLAPHDDHWLSGGAAGPPYLKYFGTSISAAWPAASETAAKEASSRTSKMAEYDAFLGKLKQRYKGLRADQPSLVQSRRLQTGIRHHAYR